MGQIICNGTEVKTLIYNGTTIAEEGYTIEQYNAYGTERYNAGKQAVTITSKTFTNSSMSGNTTWWNPSFDAAVEGKKVIGYGIVSCDPMAVTTGNGCSVSITSSLSGSTITVIISFPSDTHFNVYAGSLKVIAYYIDA